MNDTLENELREMYRAQSAHLPDHGPGIDVTMVGGDRGSAVYRRRRWMVGAAAAGLVAIGGAGVVAIANRPNLSGVEQTPTNSPSNSGVPPSAVTVPAPASTARLTLDQPPAGARFFGVSEAPVTGIDPAESVITRIYSSKSHTPDQDPYLRVHTAPAPGAMPLIPESAAMIDIGGHSARQWSAAGIETIALRNGDRWFWIESHAIADPAAVAASVTMAADGFGAVIDASLLPDGVGERAVGALDEVRFRSREQVGQTVTSGHWEIGNDYSAGYFYQAIPESPADFELHRIEYSYTDLADIDVNGYAGVLAEGSTGSPFTSVMWNDGQYTFVVGGYGGVSSADTVAVARALRPATEAEWRALQQKSAEMIAERQRAEGTATTVTIVETTAP